MAKTNNDELSPEERHLKIEEDYQKAQIAALKVKTFSMGLEIGLPVRIALKEAGIKMDDNEIKALETTRKAKKTKK
jgi:hypothetical protein